MAGFQYLGGEKENVMKVYFANEIERVAHIASLIMAYRVAGGERAVQHDGSCQ